MATPHDKLVKAVFSQLEHARSELMSVLPAAIVDKADWSTLALESGEFVDPALAHLHTDLLYTVKLAGRTACIYVLFEHMSTVEPHMPFRLLRTMTKIWSRFEQDHPGERLPLIIPLVLHHSRTGWTAAMRFAELLDLDDELRSLASPFVPDFSFVLDDLSKLDDEALRKRPVTDTVRLTLVVLPRRRDGRDPVAILRPWASTIVAVLTGPSGLEALSAVARYIMETSEGRAEELGALFRELGPDVQEAYVTIAEQIAAQALLEGEARGEVRGQASILLKQLALRFGPLSEAVRTRIQGAAPAELEQWAERVLSAETLEQVLDV